MWPAVKKSLFHPSILGFGLLAVFVIAVIGCGSGMLPSASAMHGGDMKCSSMFTDQFIVSQKDLGSGLALVLLTAALFVLSAWSGLLAGQLLSRQHAVHRFLKARNRLLRLHDPTLQQFSAGILHPQIY